MQSITFYKYQGTGNDFIMIDGRIQEINLSNKNIQDFCNRRFGIGADGVIILKNHPTLDFEMDYYNADGSQSMCGNGGRCAVQFARHMGLLKNEFHFLAIDGEHLATIEENEWVHLKMKDVNGVKSINNDYELNTGSPHYIKLVAQLDNINVVKEGRAIRNSESYEQEGINVNFVQTINDTSIFVRTYERGVEDETLSCGTGVTAASLISAHNDRGFNRIEVETLGGKLAVEFDRISEEHFNNIWLCGPATFVYKGEKALA